MSLVRSGSKMARPIKAIGKVDTLWQRNIRLTVSCRSVLQICHLRLHTWGNKNVPVTKALFSPLHYPNTQIQHPYTSAVPALAELTDVQPQSCNLYYTSVGNLCSTRHQSTDMLQFRTAKPYHAAVRLAFARHTAYICCWWQLRTLFKCDLHWTLWK